MRKIAITLMMAASLPSCGKGSDQQQLPPVPVEVAVARTQSTPLYAEYVGDVRAVKDVGIYPRVGGVLLRQNFVDGGLVRQGQLLFVIDPREYQTSVAAAQAQLAGAQAQAARAQQDVARYRPLVEEDAISRQVYDNAVATARANAAQVSAARASVEQARIGLSYAYIRAPISGRIGNANVDVGTLVAPGTTELARISDASTVEVYFSPSEQEVLRFQQLPEAERQEAGSGIELILSDGSVFPATGRINFADRAFDAATGSYRLRAIFPNPDNALLPGQFGRVKIKIATRPDAIVIPDKAVVEQFGTYFVMVVGPANKVEQRRVEAGPHVGGEWIIDKGLKPGEKVIVEGLGMARPGAVVQPTAGGGSGGPKKAPPTAAKTS
ncbi:MAG: efflux RND transporter periplasmic adaptor subunit [Sphingopyxis sp.]|uniref:efflux RND transporter periplasmic adaptor subunit n=1 Tax=Sphingopyxis sp. TaxID=1908224 RepID=UPI002ABB40E9|nr:efflux RND transporter periplasmic adaptor subunit [Sphingopyxis sp.]MDZ3832823.1 efflux RND transporter periplasmic adaptor subunit [Sphingopyxis sp.]